MLFADTIKKLREDKHLVQRQLAAELQIDTPMYSRIERGERPATREQVEIIARVLNEDPQTLINLWLAEKVYRIIEEVKEPQNVLDIVAENVVEYKTSSK